MRKLVAILVVVVLPALLAACAASAPNEDPPDPEAAFLEQLRLDHPDLDYGANGYPLFPFEAQVEATERYREALREQRIEGLRETIPPRDWIATPYHGEVLDANLEPIELDEETLGLILDSMLELLWETAEPAAIEELGLRPEAVASIEAAGAVRLAVQAGVARALVEASLPEIQESWAWRQQLVQEAVFMLPLWAELELLTLEDLLVPSPLHEILPRFRVPYVYYLPKGGLPSYNDLCAGQDVPRPPDWPDPRWQPEGKLGLQFGGGKIYIFSYHQPGKPGACIALQRWLPNRQTGVVEIAALGVICQSAVSGKACFWDNLMLDPKTKQVKPIRGQSIRMEMGKVRNGSNLASPCTHCHKGENVFLIHPGTALEVTRKAGSKLRTDPGKSGWYSPMGQSHWTNPGPVTLPNAAADRSCTACHQLPEVGGTYCDRILLFAATMTMPPPGGAKSAGWPAAAGSKWRGHTQALVDLCRKVP